jgi:cell division protein FtsZ
MGYAMMGTATGRGENAAVEAARQAISCPLLEETHIAGARSILINITGSSRLGFHEVNEACAIIREAAQCEDAQINFGVILDESLTDTAKVTVIATGFKPESATAFERRSMITPIISVQTPVPEPVPAPEPEPVIQPVPVQEPEPVPAMLNAEPDVEPDAMLDMDDLDTPAYLRQRRLLN